MPNEKMFDFLEESLEIIDKKELKLDAPDGSVRKFRPSFTSLSAYLVEEGKVKIKNGSTFRKELPKEEVYKGRLEVRMGDHERGGAMNSCTFVLPVDLDKKASWSEIWQKANDILWRAARNYESNIVGGMGATPKEKRELFNYFSRENQSHFEGIETKLGSSEFSELEDNLRHVTRDLAHPDIFENSALARTTKINRFYVNSEGSRIFTSKVRHNIYLTSYAIDENNFGIPNDRRFLIRDSKDFPSYEQLMTVGEQSIKEVLEIVKAPIQENDALPAILCPENHGVLWHEVIGHSLEAHRMQEDEWGEVTTTFKDHIGKKVAPDFLSLYEDPTDKTMWGHYLFDGEGIPAQKVVLIENGVLKSYLHSRESAGYFGIKSNGHARAEVNKDPTPRMSNIIVVSSNAVPYGELKENLKKLCHDNGKEYGLILKDSSGGYTLPEESYYQTVPNHIFRVYTDGREDERVRGIYIVGTPHQTLQNIVQTSDRYGSFLGFCGAESGRIDSEEKAPDALVRQLEINRLPKMSYWKLFEPVLPR